MANDPRRVLKEFQDGAAAVMELSPKPVQMFQGYVEAVKEKGALDTKTKALIALSIGISTHCEYCIANWVNEALKEGATREELMETIFVVGLMCGGPGLAYGMTMAKDAIDTFAPDYGK